MYKKETAHTQQVICKRNLIYVSCNTIRTCKYYEDWRIFEYTHMAVIDEVIQYFSISCSKYTLLICK